jgi:carbon-monoxide dehydrogenase iron sulfur subunit
MFGWFGKFGRFEPEDRVPDKMIFANPDLCTGCKLCSIACAMTHLGVANPRKGSIIVRQNLYERYEFQSLCRHCDPAPCLDACMTG